MKQYSQILGELIKEVRINKGLSQSEVAKRMGFNTNGYISDFEAGRYQEPDVETLKRYAKALEISYEEIESLKRKATLMSVGVHEENIFTEMLRIPILGTVPCGEPSEAIEETNEYFPIPFDISLAKRKHIFGLRANGLSMKDAGIFPGDIIIIDPYLEVRNGDIVVAKIGDNATMKFYFERGGYVELRPANEDFKPIKTNDPTFTIVGKVIKKITVQDYV